MITKLKSRRKNGAYFFKSEYDGSWWHRYETDKPNDFIGSADYLPEYAKKELEALSRNEPDIVYRVSIHNRIYNTCYYSITEWVRAINGGWSCVRHSRIGRRGKGGNLGMTLSDAINAAAQNNREAGWTAGMKILNSNGREQFDLHI